VPELTRGAARDGYDPRASFGATAAHARGLPEECRVRMPTIEREAGAAVKQLATADLADVVDLQAEVTAGLPAGFVWAKDEDRLRGYLDGRLGAAYGIVEGAALVAMALLRLPDPAHPNPGPRLRLVPEEDWPLRACFLENAMVRPAARGRGHQRALIEARLAHAASTGTRWACTGVRLRNAASWANLLAKGMVIADSRLDLGPPILGLLVPLQDPKALALDANDRRSVDARDHAGHRRALEAGYVGVRASADRAAVTYQRLRPSRASKGSALPERLVQAEDAVRQVG
jgi:GNAT superfamily N-acetyltransferase